MAVYYCTLRGTIHTSTLGEIFSHSIGIETSKPVDQVATALHDTWATAWLDFDQYFSTTITYDEATAAPVLDPTVPDLGAATHVPFLPPLTGASANGLLPPQCALAVSWYAGYRADGRPLKGRMYLPTPHMNVAVNDGLVPPAATAAIAIGMRNWLVNLRNNQQCQPVVWSRVTDDLVNPITAVRVGNKIDTIRSRRNRYPETYALEAIPPPA